MLDSPGGEVALPTRQRGVSGEFPRIRGAILTLSVEVRVRIELVGQGRRVFVHAGTTSLGTNFLRSVCWRR